MKKLLSFIHESTLVEQAPELGHSRVQHCIDDMEMEDLEAQFEDKVALGTDEIYWLTLVRMGKLLLSWAQMCDPSFSLTAAPALHWINCFKYLNHRQTIHFSFFVRLIFFSFNNLN